MRKAVTLAAGAVVAGGVAGGVAVAWRRRPRPEEQAAPAVEVLGGEERTVKTGDGAELAATVAGDPHGRLFTLAHGWGCDRATWLPVAERLVAAGHRVALYDQRGHGASTLGEDGLTMEALGDDIRAVLEDLDAREAVLAGHSMGGMAVQSFATRHPDVLAARVRGLALVSTACDKVVVKGLAGRIARQVVSHPGVDRALTHATLGPLLVRGATVRRSPRAWRDSLRTTFTTTSSDVRIGCFDAMAAMDLSEKLADVDVPTLVMVGSWDLMTLPARSRRLAQLIRGSRLEVVPGAGHMLPFEAPDRVAAALQTL